MLPSPPFGGTSLPEGSSMLQISKLISSLRSCENFGFCKSLTLLKPSLPPGGRGTACVQRSPRKFSFVQNRSCLLFYQIVSFKQKRIAEHPFCYPFVLLTLKVFERRFGEKLFVKKVFLHILFPSGTEASLPPFFSKKVGYFSPSSSAVATES